MPGVPEVGGQRAGRRRLPSCGGPRSVGDGGKVEQHNGGSHRGLATDGGDAPHRRQHRSSTNARQTRRVRLRQAEGRDGSERHVHEGNRRSAGAVAVDTAAVEVRHDGKRGAAAARRARRAAGRAPRLLRQQGEQFLELLHPASQCIACPPNRRSPHGRSPIAASQTASQSCSPVQAVPNGLSTYVDSCWADAIGDHVDSSPFEICDILVRRYNELLPTFKKAWENAAEKAAAAVKKAPGRKSTKKASEGPGDSSPGGGRALPLLPTMRVLDGGGSTGGRAGSSRGGGSPRGRAGSSRGRGGSNRGGSRAQSANLGYPFPTSLDDGGGSGSSGGRVKRRAAKGDALRTPLMLEGPALPMVVDGKDGDSPCPLCSPVASASLSLVLPNRVCSPIACASQSLCLPILCFPIACAPQSRVPPNPLCSPIVLTLPNPFLLCARSSRSSPSPSSQTSASQDGGQCPEGQRQR